MAFRLLAALALFSFCCLSIPTYAQMAGTEEEPTFDLNFPGGTVSEFYEYFKSNGYDTQVIISDEAKAIKIPPLKASGVPVRGFFDLADEFSNKRGRLLSKNVAGVFSLRLKPKQRLLATADLSSNIPRNSSKEVIDKELEPILRAIKTATEFINSEGSSQIEMPAFRFHPETGLLFVIGTADELNIARNIFSNTTNATLEIVPFSTPSDSPAKADDNE